MKKEPLRKIPLLAALSPGSPDFLPGLPGGISQDLPMSDILDIKSSVIFPEEPSYWPWICGAAAIFFLGILLFWWWHRRKKHALFEKFDPAEEARTRLKNLQEGKDQTLSEKYHELALILRLALEASLLPGAREKTLEEIWHSLPRFGPKLSDKERRELECFLRRLGEVQFGKDLPSENELEQHLELITELVNRNFSKEDS